MNAVDANVWEPLRLRRHVLAGILDSLEHQRSEEFHVRLVSTQTFWQVFGDGLNPVHLSEQGIGPLGEANFDKVLTGDGHLLSGIGVQHTVFAVLLVLAYDADIVAVEAEAVLRRIIRQVIDAYHTAYGYLLLKDQLVELVHGFLLVEESLRGRLDA